LSLISGTDSKILAALLSLPSVKGDTITHMSHEWYPVPTAVTKGNKGQNQFISPVLKHLKGWIFFTFLLLIPSLLPDPFSDVRE